MVLSILFGSHNSGYFPIQNNARGFHNLDELCLERGTDISSSVISGCQP